MTSPMRGHHQFAKLSAPRAIDIVRRTRVSGLIEEALRSGRCWLAAPAGYGKTTALARTHHAPLKRRRLFHHERRCGCRLLRGDALNNYCRK